jgi:hypothetical protein
MKKLLKALIINIFIMLPCMAEQTIITIPSSDVLPKGEWMLKESNRSDTEGNVNLTPYVIFGTGWGTESTIGVGTSIGNTTDVSLDLRLKKVFKAGENTRFTVGGRIRPSLTNGSNPDSMIYAHSSYIIRKTKTTITAGGYVAGYGQMPGSTGVMVGIDQTIIPKKLRLVADWMSRQDAGCVFAAGLKYRPEPTTSITTAVLIPNNGERVGFSISISKYLGKLEKKKKEVL